MRPQAQVSKEELAAAKQELRAIDARPIKKVVEARARKQKRLKMRLDTVGAEGWVQQGAGAGTGGCKAAAGCASTSRGLRSMA